MTGVCSVIIPVYNAERYLPAAIESVIGQTESDLQIILINDGSTDNSQSIIERYAERDPRIMGINQPNSGVSAARNMGLSYADSEFVLFLDADDWLEPDAIRYLSSLCQTQNASMAIAGYYHYLDENQFEIKSPIIQPDTDLLILNQKQLLKKYIASDNGAFMNSKLYRTSYIQQYSMRFLNAVTIGEDYIFNLSYISRIDRCCIVSRPLYHYRFVPGSLSRKYYSKLFDNYLVVDAVKRDIIKNQLGDCKQLMEMEDRYISDIYSRCINELTYLKSRDQIAEILGRIVLEAKNKQILDRLQIGFYQFGQMIKFMLKHGWIRLAADNLYFLGSIRRLVRP